MISEIRAKVDECRAIAEKHYGRSFPPIQIKMDLKGKTAGQHIINLKKKRHTLRFNTKLAVKNRDHYLKVTVPHEFAHFIQRVFFPDSDAHGKEWKSIMIQVFKLPPTRCHNYDLSHIEKRTKPFVYSCEDCGFEYQFGPKRHANMKENSNRYECGKCHGKLIYAKALKPRSRNPEKKKMIEIDLD